MGSKSASSGAAKSRSQGNAQGANPALDAIDLDYLRRFTLGNMALEQEVLQLFAGQAPLYLQQLRSAASAKDWIDAAHTIKGSAAAIGARRLASVAEIVERLDVDSQAAQSEGAREQAIGAVADALAEVCRCIARLAAAA